MYGREKLLRLKDLGPAIAAAPFFASDFHSKQLVLQLFLEPEGWRAVSDPVATLKKPRRKFMQCSNCKFFNSSQSECRRYAPSPSETDMTAQWPNVAAQDWCGEFIASDAERVAA